MLRLQKLELFNFITYKYQDIDFNLLFEDSNILLIYGRNLDDISFASDNGAGKSILYQAILFALTGRTTRGTSPDLLIGKFAKSMACSLHILDSNNDRIWIKRYRKHANFGNEVRLRINGIEIKKGKSREMTTFLLNYLSLSYRRIINTSVFESDDERSRFIYLNDKDGKALLSQIKGLEIFQKCFEVAKEQVTEIENEINKTEHSISLDENTIAQNREFLRDTEIAYHRVDDEVNKEIQQIEQQTCDEINEAAKNTRLFKDEIAVSKKAIEKIKALIVEPPSIEPVEERLKGILETIQGIIKAKTLSESLIHSNEVALKFLERNKGKLGKVCNFCGGIIKGEHLRKHIASTKNSLKMEQFNIARFEEQAVKIGRQRQKTEIEIIKIKEQIKQNEEKETQIKSLKVRIKECIQLLAMASKNLSRVLKVLESRKVILSKKKNILLKNISDIKERIEKVEQNLSKLVKHKNFLNKKYRYNHAWFLGFSKEGLQTSALRATVKELNSEINRISEILTDGTIDIQLVTEKVLKSKRVKNMFEFEISDNNKKNLPFKEWSKGQKKRIEIIVSFALMSIEDSIISEVFLDELFDGIDEVGINKIKTLLDNEAQIKDKRFVIFSHSKEIKDLFTNRAYVQLENGISTLHKED